MAVTDAREITVRDTIISMINTDAATITGGIVFTATANWLPEYFKQQLSALQVDVRIVASTDTGVLDRFDPPGTIDRYRFEITYQMAVAIEDTDRIDLLASMAKRCYKLFEPNLELTGLSNPMVIVDPESPPTIDICDPFYLRSYSVFYAKIDLITKEYVSNI